MKLLGSFCHVIQDNRIPMSGMTMLGIFAYSFKEYASQANLGVNVVPSPVGRK